LLVVRLPHGRSATVTDPLALGGGGAEDILVLMPGSIGYFGTGAAIMALDAAFPGGWRGGALPARGFWGIAGETVPDEAALLAVLASVRTACRTREAHSKTDAKTTSSSQGGDAARIS